MIPLQEKLKNFLVENKLVSVQDLENALRFQKENGGSLSHILVKMGLIHEKDLMLALSYGLGIPLLKISRFKIDDSLSKIIPVDFIKKYEILPLAKIGRTLTVATSDPLNIFALDDLRQITGLEINPIISSSDEIKEKISTLYEQKTGQIIENLIDNISKPDLEIVSGGKNEVIERTVEEAPIVKFTDSLLKRAVDSRASDILIEPLEKRLRIRFRIDGVLQEVESPPKATHPYMVTRIKVLSNLDIAEHRLPQDGRFKARISGRIVDFRVSCIPSSFGEKVALRILDRSQALLDLDRLGFEDDSLEVIKKCASRPHGMILVCGPSGSGKTTSLYSILKFVDDPEKNLITVEDPVEYQIDTVTQVNVNTEVGLTFASALRSILRQDPDIIMVGEIRDYDTLDISIKAALTGHLLLSTIHTTTAPGAIIRLVNMGAESYLLTSTLVGVLAQRLVRRLCEHCKEEYVLSPDIVSRLGFKESRNHNLKVFRPKGCRYCLNTGYRGRIGICEVLFLSPQIKKLVLKGAQEYEIKKQGRLEGMRTLREDGLLKVVKGITSLDEVVKSTAPDEPL